MKLEYNIFWLDNDIQDYIDNGEVNNIKTFLEELGFEPHIITINDEALLDDFIHKYKYDLIISDFNLNVTTGDEIIDSIRKKGLSTEILFYSAQNDFRKIPEVKDRLAFMDRITFHSGRGTFLDKLEKVIELTLEKLLEINATRGLITASTSDLDVELEEIYYLVIDLPIEDAVKAKIEKIFRTDFKEVEKSITKRCEIQRENHVSDYKLYFENSDAFRKWDILKELISLNVPEGFKLDLFKEYSRDVIDIRNKFAHAKAEQNGDGQYILKGMKGKEGFQFDKNACIQIRKNLINHKNNIAFLKETLKK